MSYDIYRYISIGALVLAIVMLLATVAIFFLLNIKNVIGDLTGSNARKGIENIRNQSTSTSGRSDKKNGTDKSNVGTAHAVTNDSAQTSKIKLEDRYDNLEASETTTLSSAYTMQAQENESSAYVTQATYQNRTLVPINPNFIVETDITYVHSEEVIDFVS